MKAHEWNNSGRKVEFFCVQIFHCICCDQQNGLLRKVTISVMSWWFRNTRINSILSRF